MNTTSGYLFVRGIEVDIVYKDIKNLHIGVYPPMGRVRVAAPNRLDDERVRLAVIQRLPWIKKQRQQLRSAERQSKREMVTGESHYVDGMRYLLKVVERPGRAHIELDKSRLAMYIPDGTTAERKREILERWYRERLRATVPDLIIKWEPVMGIAIPRWTIRKMKTKWGSCNRKTGHLWFNVELVKHPPQCLEYIVVHEMAHFFEPNHGDRYAVLMDKFLPDWRSRRDLLNQVPLAQEDWSNHDEY